MSTKYKILVVDDQRDNLLRIVEMIEEKFKDWEILHALDGSNALKIAEIEKPDLILLDWEMPGLNGIETTNRLKENSNTNDIPVIICTGKMRSSRHLETALAAGAVDYIRKPIDKVELLARLQSMLLLSESYQRIKQLSQNKDKLLSIIAHDLKNPLYTIKLLLDFINEQKISGEKRDQLLKRIGSSVTSTFGLLENLLAWANSQRNTVIYMPENHLLLNIIQENLELFKPDSDNKSIKIQCLVDKDLIVFVDKNMVSTIIRNLLSNAVKFTAKHGNVSISANRKKDKIEIVFEDDGIGISESDLQSIQQERINFTRPGTNNEIGSGIGLQLCKEFISSHNGTFLIESIENKGTIVKFTLPAQKL